MRGPGLSIRGVRRGFFSRAVVEALLGAALAALLAANSVAPAAAEPLERKDVPLPLQPWIDWVLAGHEEARCPLLQGEGGRACLWPGRLALELDAKGGRFSESVFVARASEVPLPGAAGTAWPEDVRVGGERVAVLEAGGVPRVRLEAGSHVVEGRLVWAALPPILPVPGEIGLLDLLLGGRSIAHPRRDAGGGLWLREANTEAAAAEVVENRVDVEVARRFEDAVPPRLTTLVTLRVSGAAREERLGVALPADWLATAISSPLPARLDPDGRLRVQVRPGDWTLEIDARLAKPSLRLASPAQPEGAVWDDSEVLSLSLAPELRLLEPNGLAPVDPTQAEIPPDWQSLPTYRLEAGSALDLVEKRRGDEGSPGDQLTLARIVYLDFDGRGATVLDQLRGTLRRSLRVEMGPGSELGRVAIGGIDQPITRRGEDGSLGVETTLGDLALDADSRIPATPSKLAAVGWAHDVDQLSATLWLPPGFRLLHASGVDTATSTWISSWDLLSVFFVLLMTVVSARLFGGKGAVLALATLALVWNEPGAPARIWLALAVVEALRRAVGHGRFARAVLGVEALVVVVLIVIAVPFAIDQIRSGLFPALGTPGGGGAFNVADFANVAPQDPFGGVEEMVVAGAEGGAADAPMEMAHAAPEAMPQTMAPASPEADAERELALRRGLAKIAGRAGSLGSHASSVSSFAASKSTALEADPSAVVPTGPGRPEWRWESVELAWSGPVTRDQVLGLWLVPPWANGLLSVVRVALIVALAGLFVRSARAQVVAGAGLGPLGTVLGGATTALAAIGALVRSGRLGLILAAAGCALSSVVAAPARADMPSPEMLEALRTRLLENPTCLPACADLSTLALDVAPERLRLVAAYEARVETGVPLPGGGAGEASWWPGVVRVDGQPTSALRRDANGVLWVRLAAGAHEVVLEGPLPDRATVELSLPIAPRRTSLASEPKGFTVVGIGPDGSASGAIQLVREAREVAVDAKKDETATFEPTSILPFVELTRSLELGLRWRTRTSVRRVAPVDGPIVLEIPLLPGESVTTANVRVEKGVAKLTLAAGESVASYDATLEVASAMALQAPADRPWTEVWELAAAPVWHVEASGLPPVDLVHEGARSRVYRPWPGERLELAIERPAVLEAATRTIDRASLAVSPGARATDATLSLALRSSQGGQHVVTLPEAAQLTSLVVDGQPQPLRQEGRDVSIPIAPGARQVVLGWREDRGVRALFETSEVGLGADAVNATVELTLPENRWLLYTHGPRLGPAVLFWSSLVVVAGLAVLVARTRWTPLRTGHGLLLGVGLTQASLLAGATVVVWFVVLGLRGRYASRLRAVRPWLFTTIQLALGLLTLAAAAALIHAIANGLLGTPDMRVAGNGSGENLLRWFVDRSPASLTRPWALSLSIWWYRAVMLAWSMWLALALVDWARWAFAGWSAGGMLRPDPSDAPPTPEGA